MTIINEILNNLGLIGDFIKLILKLIDNTSPEILIILVFVVFLVVMFKNSVVTKKSAYRKY